MEKGNMHKLTGNRGEWSEIYVFLKIISDGKIYAADKYMNKIDNVYLNVVRVIREEIQSQVYEYHTGENVKIFLNGNDLNEDVSVKEFQKYKNELWDTISNVNRGNGIQCLPVEKFLDFIHVHKLKSPAFSKSGYFGGTQDITMEVMDYRSGINSVIGFSCKSDFSGRSTLFNASKDNTNFKFKIQGNLNDAIMNEFNGIYKNKKKLNKDTGETEINQDVAIKDRIKFLKTRGYDVSFVGMCGENAERNLILSGGTELPTILAGMLKAYYWEGEGKTENSTLLYALSYAIENNVAGYKFEQKENMYIRKLGTLLYDMFTGLKMSKPWDGRSSVNGGYIVVKSDGDVVAYHSCIADEFKDFLINQLGFDSPSAKRHNYMQIYKENEEYFINFNLQIRFKGNLDEPQIDIEKRKDNIDRIYEYIESKIKA